MTKLLTLDEKQTLADYCNQNIDFEYDEYPFNATLFLGCVFTLFGTNRALELDMSSYNDFMSYTNRTALPMPEVL
jgi:hypothetical protein